MTAATMYWLENLHDYNLERSLPLPFDRYRLAGEHRTDRGTSVTFDFGQELSQAFLIYSSLHKIKLDHLALACYYVFLFKLSNGEKDLCIGMKTHNRYKDELKSMIGLFENIIPVRCQLNPHSSFHQLVTHTDGIMINNLEYSYFPLQRILAQHPNSSKAAFLDTFFGFQSNQNKDYKSEIMISDAHLLTIPYSILMNKDQVPNNCDFAVIIQHDLNTNQLSCTIDASLDLFNKDTIDTIAQRFHSMFDQLFLFPDYWITETYL